MGGILREQLIIWVPDIQLWFFVGLSILLVGCTTYFTWARRKSTLDKQIQIADGLDNVEEKGVVDIHSNKPPELKNRLSQQILSGNGSTNYQAGRDINVNVANITNFPRELVDQNISAEVERLRKSRFFVKFDLVRSALTLGRSIAEGGLSHGSDELRAFGLSWCVRLLSGSEELDRAENFLKLAKELGNREETKIAEAFIFSRKEDRTRALQILASVTSKASNSASLIIVAKYDGFEAAIEWMNKAGLAITDLDSDGKWYLLQLQLENAHWDDVKLILDRLSEDDFRDTPVLHHSVAIANLLTAVPTQLRSFVLNNIPFDISSFPLASDSISLNARRTAHGHFVKATKIEQELGCASSALIDDQYALWLELQDFDQSNYGRTRLQAMLRDSSYALTVVHFALQFSIKLDLDEVERSIEKSIAMNGGMTEEAAMARFSLTFSKNTPEEKASYITHHYDQLASYINPKEMLSLQISMYLEAGMVESARTALKRLIELGISVAEENRLRLFIAETEGIDPVEALKSQYDSSGALVDLRNLVRELEARGYWEELCKYGKQLFELTRTLTDAERLVDAFEKSHRSNELVSFVRDNSDFQSLSLNLHMSYAWALYNEGSLAQAREELTHFKGDINSSNYRALQINICITIGDWDWLSNYALTEYQNRDKRSAHELIKAAHYARSPELAKNLVFAAASKADDDAAALAGAYFFASRAGWEDDPKVFQWFERAAELSGDNGPVQRKSLKDILKQKPEWDQRESDTWRMLGRGEIPIFLASRSLNRSLIDLTIFPALANLAESDARCRSAIPSFSGKRISGWLDPIGKVVALDATALLNLSFLQILDETLDIFKAVYIPHSTLSWLFEEWHKAEFHQPSRVHWAHKLSDLLRNDALEKFTPSTIPDTELSVQVGDDLAALIAEAEKIRDDDVIQHIVVRSAPVHRLSSLLEEEADLSGHAKVLCSCLAVVEKLRQKGKITADQENRARTYLQMQERSWPNQPEISDGAILYLDHLTVNYFLHLGLLGELKGAGLKAVIATRVIKEVCDLISYERLSNEVKKVIERIRYSLNARIESGHIKVGSRRTYEERNESIIEHPTASIFALTSFCDLAIVDDRYINQHDHIQDGTLKIPLYCTLDLLNGLSSAGVISNSQLVEIETRLRRAGYLFIPVSKDGIKLNLLAAETNNENIVETAELKAIRESILRVRMSDWLQLPHEALWLNEVFKVFVSVLRELWINGAELDQVIARSNWLADQIDIRGWAHCFNKKIADNVVETGRGPYILLLLTPPMDTQQSIVDAYWGWVETKFLEPIKEQFPKLYAWILEWYTVEMRKCSEIGVAEEVNPMSTISVSKFARAQALLSIIPPMICQNMLDNQAFRQMIGIEVETTISFGDEDISFRSSVFFSIVRAVLAGTDQTQITDSQGIYWNLRNEASNKCPPSLVLLSDKKRLILPEFGVLSEHATIRIDSLEKIASDVNLPVDAKEKWHILLTKRALDDDELDSFHSDLYDTPVHFERMINTEIKSGRGSISSLIPNSRKYYQRLVGIYEENASLKSYAEGNARKLFINLASWRPYEGFLLSLLLSSHSAFTAEINVDHLNKDEIVKAYDFIEKYGDPFSRLGALEIGLRILPDRPEIEPFLLPILLRIRDDKVEEKSSEFKLLKALFMLVDGELSRTRLLANEPPFYRRLASFAQAGLIHRQIAQNGIDYDHFSRWATSLRNEQFYMQSLADMRIEPRWDPILSDSSQMKQEFFGRLMNASSTFADNIYMNELRGILLGKETQSLASLSEFPHPYLPGPLEGAEDSSNPLPDEFACIIEQQLNREEVEISSFIALVNFAMVFRATSLHAELAAKALRLANYRLASLSDKSQLLNALNGLASVAAVSRNRTLADELRILERRYRRDPLYGFSIESSLRICLVAAASSKDIMEWREFVGQWLTELAFSDLTMDDGKLLYSCLTSLLHSVPELWFTCARANAALQALCSR